MTLTLGLGYLAGTAIFSAALIVLLAVQVRADRFHSALYWAVVTATTLTGTTLADFCDRSLSIGYAGGSVILLSSVVLTLLLWKRALGTVAVETVRTPRAEGFYWATIMFSQTLGTALGDWMADSTGLGYNGSALLILVALTGTAALYWRTRISRTLLFWTAFVLTRPLGATLANSFDKPPASGGLGISDITITAALAVLMVACVLAIPQRAGGHPGSANAA